ncbi:cyanophycin synthetase [Engelhardtia mirabilis]|uniref:Cyanophycin synthetase n=1 Tax=Engelhardtia mirabilis TaxID=2528011 RepID=A0A518BF54_9BACT|nr:Cyanophycin synthetase [Planctomycetes bacterium Pla133]QDU99917.1 Cyanophycin synthetase [Planctomycetes bacterium Pla86]
MRIVSQSVYLGPNIYANWRLIGLTVDLGALEEWPTVKLGSKWIDALLQAIPTLEEHGCSYGEPGGFLRRMREDEGTWLGHVLEHCAIEIQNLAGADLSFGQTRSTGTPGQYHVVYDYDEPEVGLEAGELALKLILSLLPAELRPKDAEDAFDWDEERDAFIRRAQRLAFGPSTASLIKAAEERDIPWLRLNNYSLVQFGHGRYQKRIQATITSETRHIAVEIASDKEETNQILGDLGLPVPQQRIVRDADRAVRAARRIGYPVVVKPLNANHGRGVSIGLETDEQVLTAFEKAREHSRTILVEAFIRGLDHRMLVVDGKLIAVSKRVPGHVVGDGKHSIAELVEITNEDPRRGIGHEKVLTKLDIDHQARRLLNEAGLEPESVLEQGQIQFLRATANLSTGGTAVDMTDVVHPDNRAMAERAAKAVGLDVCGVDFLTTDITRSYKETKGAICEVNAAPGFRMHVAPSEGHPRDVAGPVIDMLFPPGSPRRIPIAAITGTNGKTTTTRMTAHVLKMAGRRVGFTTTDGVYIDGKLSVEGDMTGPTAARMVLRDPSVDTAVLETARGGLLKRGMGYRRCNVGAVLNIDADHLGLRGIETLEQLARVKRVVIEVAKDTAVLNADDEHCLRMASFTSAEQICYVTMSPTHPLVKEHIRAGGRAVVLEEGMGGQMITIYDNGAHIPLLWTHEIPATIDGKARHNVQNALFASAITFSMGATLDDIRIGLRTFDTTFAEAPGRMNVYDDHPFKVIVDYGHNPAAIAAMVHLTDQLHVKGRRLILLAAPGDRRDQDIEQMASSVAGHYDHYIVRRDDNPRGRGPLEVPHLLRDSLLENGVPEQKITVIEREVAAVDAALDMARPDDLLLVFADAIERTWRQVTEFESVGEVELKPTVSAPQPAAPAATAFEMELPGIDDFIHDERGVLLAPVEEDDELAD